MSLGFGLGVDRVRLPQGGSATPWLPGTEENAIFAFDTIEFGASGLWADLAKTTPASEGGDVYVIENEIDNAVGDAVLITGRTPAKLINGSLRFRQDSVYSIDTSSLGTLNMNAMTMTMIGGFTNLGAKYALVNQSDSQIMGITTVGAPVESYCKSHGQIDAIFHNQLDSPIFFGFCPGGGAVKHRMGHQTATLSASTSLTFTSVAFGGRSTGSYAFPGAIYGLALYAEDFGATKLTTHNDWHNARARQDVYLVCNGDSITNGTTVVASDSWDLPYPQTLGERLFTDYSVAAWGVNTGVGGATALNMRDNASAQVDALYKSGFSTYVNTICGGTNDYFYGTTDPSVVAGYIWEWCAARRAFLEAQGVPSASIIIGVTTQIDRDVATAYKTFLDDLNGIIRDNWSTYADVLIDPESDAHFSISLDASTNTTYYTDGTHPTAAGHAILADIFAAALGPLL